MNPQDAVDAPRIHHQWMPDRITMEKGISPDTIDALKARGHDARYEGGPVTAEVEMILIDNGWLQARGAIPAARVQPRVTSRLLRPTVV